jgi:hypothetical protein
MYFYVYHGSRPHLPAEEGSGTTTCPMVLDSASLLGRVLTLSHVPWLQTSLPAREGSSAATYPTVPNPTSLLGRAPTLSHVLQLRAHFHAEESSGATTCPMAPVPLPCWGGLQFCHVSHSSLRVVSLKYKGSYH